MSSEAFAPSETAPAFTDLIFEDLGPVARLTLNRPSVMNALSIRLSGDLIRAFEFLRDSDRFKMVVIQGAGDNFCVGDDLGEMAARKWGNVNQAMRRVRLYQHMANTLEELDKITVCAVDGYCVGGGLELSMACDFVICTERARWGMPEVDWGIHPGWGGTTRLARLIGRRMAKEINLLGALHPARRGKDLGLFNRIVADHALEAETQALIDLLLTKNQQGLRQLKFSLNKNVEADLYTAQAFEVLGGAVTVLAGHDGVEDADKAHWWPSYATKDPASPTRRRRELAKNFWVD
jgi:enoyl-CoA hydratase